MATNITSTTLESSIATAIVNDLGAACELIFWTAGDVELATLTGGSAYANVGTSPDSVDITDLVADTADTGVVGYATLATTGNAKEVIRFTDPVNDIGLSSDSFTNGDTVALTNLAVIVPV